MIPTLRRLARQLVPMPLLVAANNALARRRAAQAGFDIRTVDDTFRIRRGDKELRLSADHALYFSDTVDHFDFYFGAVDPVETDGVRVVDYSKPAWHHPVGFDDGPVYFPSIAEPVATVHQYLEFAALGPGSVAIDLGGYAALSSILFRKAISSGGRVITVEADERNLDACRKNLEAYPQFGPIDLVYAAIWREDGSLEFSSEGSMGSSAVSVVGAGRGATRTVPAMTLTTLARKFALDRVDFLKCDIEGAEAVVFDQPEFFAKYAPRIIVECHDVGGTNTMGAVKTSLDRFGYAFEVIEQVGYPLPLLACTKMSR